MEGMRWLRLLALPLVLALTAPVTACTEDEPYVRARAPVEEPPFDYGLYSNAQGLLVGEDSAVLLVRRPSHLERVYEDAQRGETRALVLFHQLEDTFVASGLHIADEVTSPRCLALPLPGCKPDWTFLDRLLPSRGPGAQRLREVLGTAFSERARMRGMRNALITASLNALLATTIVKGQLKGAAAQEGKAAGRGPPAATESRGLVAATTEAEVLEARLVEAEAVATEARHPASLPELSRFRPSLANPPPGMAAGESLWSDYVAYWEGRYAELAGHGSRQPTPKPPLTWEGYGTLRAQYRRGLEFQRTVTQALRRELDMSTTARRLLRGMQKPHLTENVGMGHGGTNSLTYADQFVFDEATLQPGSRLRVETFSNKSRDFKSWSDDEIITQAKADAKEAIAKYGGTVQVRRPGHPLFGRNVPVSRIHLLYDAGTIPPQLKTRLSKEIGGRGVEVHFHHPP
jgi:hypothetical protein